MEAPGLLGKMSNGQQDHIDLADVMCPICLSVLIEPVRMPCDHILCMPCFQQNVEKSSLNCPICRARISSWCRKAKKESRLVFNDLWKIIQNRFSARVEARLAGVDDVDADDIIPCLPMHQFVNKGAIKSEFDELMSKEREEMVRVQCEEERKSVELIQKLEEEDRELRERLSETKRQQEEVDKDLARKIMDSPVDSAKKAWGTIQAGAVRGKENKATGKEGRIQGPIDSFFGISELAKKKAAITNCPAQSPFTRPQKYEPKLSKSNVERCPSTESIQSNNSIDAELNHFKPIRSAPLSPPKRLPDGSIIETQVVKTKPRNLSSMFNSSPGTSDTLSCSLVGNNVSLEREQDVPDDTGSETPCSNGEPESLYCDEALRLTLTPTPSPVLKGRNLASSCNGHPSPIFKSSLDMDTQKLEEIMDQDDVNFDLLDPSIIEEQRRMEEQIKQQIEQQIADEKFAKQLQEEMDREQRSINRRKGSLDEYNLRDSAKKLPLISRLPLSPRTPKNNDVSCKSRLAMSPKTPGLSGVTSRLAMSPRTAILSGVKRPRDEASNGGEGEARSLGVKRSRQMSLLESFKKNATESSGNDSEEF